jgi:hypothetical protein
MKLKSIVNAKVGTIAAAALIAAAAGTGASVAAGQITSAQIKDGTIQTGDLTKNNFARFTATENVVNADTPVSTDPALGGARLVNVGANADAGLVTIVLNRGTWKLSGTAQFFHPTPGGVPTPADATDIGVVTVPALQSGLSKNFTGDIPNGGVNGAQVSFGGTVKITADNTPITITGAFTAGGSGTATASVSATQYEYVKLFKGGKPS